MLLVAALLSATTANANAQIVTCTQIDSNTFYSDSVVYNHFGTTTYQILHPKAPPPPPPQYRACYFKTYGDCRY